MRARVREPPSAHRSSALRVHKNETHGGDHQAQVGMMMFVVVPAKEGLAKLTGVFDGAEAVEKASAVFQGAELAFRTEIVVGNMGPGMCFGDAEVGHATGLDFIEEPRSAWMVSWPRVMSCFPS